MEAAPGRRAALTMMGLVLAPVGGPNTRHAV